MCPSAPAPPYVSRPRCAAERDDVRGWAFEERRRLLCSLLRDARPPLHPTPLTEDPRVAARWLERFKGSGIDGVGAGHRLDWVPLAPERVCEVACYRAVAPVLLPTSPSGR